MGKRDLERFGCADLHVVSAVLGREKELFAESVESRSRPRSWREALVAPAVMLYEMPNRTKASEFGPARRSLLATLRP